MTTATQIDEQARARGTTLTRVLHEVGEVALGERSEYRDGRLTVSPDHARAVLADPALAEVRVTWASPGDSARIVKILDVVQPRTKGPGGGGIFPGLLGPARPQGTGTTHVLRGVTVLAAGHLPRAQEAVLDMTGPGAGLSPFGATHNLVVEFEPAEGADWLAVDAALRRGLLGLAAHLADTALDAAPDAVEEISAAAPAGTDGPPRVAVITNLQTQGDFKDVFVYGRSLRAGLPTSVAPTDLEDGAVVSGQFGHPALRNPTWAYQNHPLLAALRKRSDLRLAGLILAPEPVDQQSKELMAESAARLCLALGADAAVVTKEGGGNADADVSLKLDALEAVGVPTVGVLAEMAGPDGMGPPLVVPPARTTALVSTGNYDERVTLPACERALGGDRVAVADAEATAEMELPTAVILGSLSPLGCWTLTARPDDR